MNQHGSARQHQRGTVQRLPATEQRAGQSRRGDEVKHDGEQGKEDDGSHSGRVWHGRLNGGKTGFVGA
ncbi:hypothetical protein GCM10027021_06740 [Dyella kyungheensis]